MREQTDRPNFLVYLAYLGVFATALNTVYLVLPNDQIKWYLMGLLVIAVMTGVLLSPKHYVTIGLVLDIAGLVVFVYYAWRIYRDSTSFGTYLGEMLSVMLVLRTFKLFRNHDFLLPLVISLTLVVFAAIPAFSADYVYSLLSFLIFLGLALFLGNVDEFVRMPRRQRRRSAFTYTYDFLEEYKPIPLSQKRPVQLLSLVGPSLKAGLPAVILAFLIASVTYFTFDHTQAPGAEAALLDAFGPAGIDAGLERQTDLLTGSRAGGQAQHYVGFDTEFDISGGRLVENSTSNKIVMEVASNLPSYWRGKAFDLYTGRGWRQSDETRSATWSLKDSPSGRQSLYHGLILDSDVSTSGIAPDPDLDKDQIKQTFYLQTNLPGIVFTAYQPIELSLPIQAVVIDDTFTLHSPDASDSMVAGQRYEVVSKKHFAQPDELKKHDYDPLKLNLEDPDFCKRYTQLPEHGTLPGKSAGFDFTRVRSEAFKVTAGKDTVYDKVAALKDWLQSQYHYSLNPPAAVPAEKDAVDFFLFDWEPRRGHCEYFSSSLAVLCRSIGIPARVVTGYATGNYNILKNRYIVQERHAHAWVEIFWPDIGWVEFDATPHTWFEGIGEDVAGGWLTFHNAMEELYVYNPRGYFRDKIFPAVIHVVKLVPYFLNQRELDFIEYTVPLVKSVERESGEERWILAAACVILLLSVTLRQKRDPAFERRIAVSSGSKYLGKVGRQLVRRGVAQINLATETDYAIQASGLSPAWGTAVFSLVDRYQQARYSLCRVGQDELRSLRRAGRSAIRAPRP